MPRIEVVGGRYGTGKSRRIVQRMIDEKWMRDSAVMVYTNEAAKVIQQRIEEEPIMPSVGTVYSLSWPYVKAFTDDGKKAHRIRSADWQRRRLTSAFDESLDHYERTAPSRLPKHHADELAIRLHAWDGVGQPPIDLSTPGEGQLKYIIPIARWLASGEEVRGKYRRAMVDEAQDMSALELAAVRALVEETVTCYGDPGQAIFAESKGIGVVPPAWRIADHAEELDQSWRVGYPAAELAERVFSYIGRRDGKVTAAGHTTEVRVWEPESVPPPRGLVLGYSRAVVARAFREWGLRDTGVTPRTANPDKELVVCTIHAAKGAEADEVYLLPPTRQFIKKFQHRDPMAVRLAYVALTRARRVVGIPYSLKVRV